MDTLVSIKKNKFNNSTKDKILFENPTNFSKPLAKIKSGRVLIVQKCNGIWCKINTDDFEGWIKTDNIWGVLD